MAVASDGEDPIVEVTLSAIEAGEVPAPTWDLLRGLMSRDSQIPEVAGAGRWALNVLERELGANWPAKEFERHGFVPEFALWSTGHRAAFHELLEVALRLDDLRHNPGFAALRRVLRNDHRHALLQLEVAALASACGHDVEFERSEVGPPMDVTFGSISVEAFTLFTDQQLRAAQRYSERIMAERQRLEFVHGVSVSGVLSGQLDESATQAWIDELSVVARRVAESTQPEVFSGEDWEVNVSLDPVPRAGFDGPAIKGRGWERSTSRIRGKAAQLEGPGGGRWLRGDLRDATYGFTGWSYQPFADRYTDLAVKLAQDVGTASIDGIVVSSGAVFVQGTLREESFRTATGATAIARDLGAFRGRETLIVPLSGAGMAEGDEWLKLYERERAWFDDALSRAGLPSRNELFP